MIRRHPNATRTDTLFPYTSLCRSYLVVFGRATGHRLNEILTPAAAQAPLPKDSADLALARLDHFRNANGGSPTPAIRTQLPRPMPAPPAVFRRAKHKAEGPDKLTQTYPRMHDIHGNARSLIRNTPHTQTPATAHINT